jgi:hypothetical protein
MKSRVLKQDPVAWEEGFVAGESGTKTALRCPYAAGTTAAWSWHSGYIEGNAKRQGYSYSRGTLPPRRTDLCPDGKGRLKED